ncbi:MAG: T9SS type A sorting domain-containing protein [Crocinitomicaceae bacterium]
MRQLLFLLTSIFLIVTIAHGQSKQNYVWKFGSTGAGIDFSTCSPTLLTNGINNLMPFEGQSAISDNTTGTLLFYTDGYNIYDSTNNVMQYGNGAGLNNSLTQTIIIKKPGSNSIYYMFTPDMQGGLVYNAMYPNSRGLNYALVDMSLNGGLGSVVSIFNSLKDTSNCEKLTAVYHSNGQDVWLIGHEYGNNNFFSFLITSSGINYVPVISSVGPVVHTWQSGSPGSSNYDAIGEMKASPNGSKLAFTSYYNGTSCLVDFDKSTGVVSNPIPLEIESGGYGVTFSPDNLKLYISGVDTNTGAPNYSYNGKIFQFDVSSNYQTTIQNSRTTIYTDPNGMFRSLKLGIDGKIYVSRGNNPNYLGVINNPNGGGLFCNYAHDGKYLSGLQGRWGLNNSIEDSSFCTLETNTLELKSMFYCTIYPNPFSLQTVLQTNISLNNANLTVHDYFGQIVSQIKNINGQTIIFERRDLKSGVYFIDFTQDNQLISMQKLVIVD